MPICNISRVQIRRHQRVCLTACLLILLALFALTGTDRSRAEAAPIQDGAAALDIIARLNEWRLSEGLWPLKPNATLESLALFQADYLVTLPSIPDGAAIHVGKSGDGPRERALFDPFDWPTYGRKDRVAVNEIGALFTSPDAAINFWKNSPVHRDTVQNSTYREVGAAALHTSSGILYIVDLGARPGVLPALIDPKTRKLDLSNERYRYAKGSAWIADASKVRFLDAANNPLSTDWLPWKSTFDVPDTVGNIFFVAYSDGKTETTIQVARDSDVALLPGFANPIRAAALATSPVATAETGTLAPTSEPPSPTPTPTAITGSPAEVPNLLLNYDSKSVTVINVGKEPLDLSNLSLISGKTTLAFAAWTKIAAFPLDALPPNHCLQARSDSASGLPDLPENCKWMRSVLSLPSNRLFWATGDFEVHQGNRVLATCEAASLSCDVVVKPQ